MQHHKEKSSFQKEEMVSSVNYSWGSSKMVHLKMSIGVRDPRESHYYRVMKVKAIFLQIKWNCSPLIPSKQKIKLWIYQNIRLTFYFVWVSISDEISNINMLEISRQIKLNPKRKCSILPNNSDIFGSRDFTGPEKVLTLKNWRQE